MKQSGNFVFSLATNDEHGVDTGRVSAIQFEDAIDLQWGEIGSEPAYSTSRTKDGYILRLGRKRFKILGRGDWYGNWCWTGITMTLETAVEFLNYLSRDDRWHCEGGWCDLTDAYSEGKVTAELMLGVEDCREVE
jgi:hypothetical protein